MVGTEVGGYRIESKIGEGGMGTVYRAIETNLERRVAVKVLNADLARNATIAERFRSEARAQANLNHTNIAVLYSFLVQENLAMMVMEFVEGENFQQMIERRGLIPSDEAIPWFKQALLGVGAAHRAGIIHRDIKPSNLMLNTHSIVKVMDFGIAKVVGERGLTRTGSQVGTVYYMSPEQIKGEHVDVRSDIYSLGVTLYEMLTAHVPFASNTDFRVLTDHVQTPPPLPSTFYPYIPKGIENIVLKALEKNPDDRFQNVEEFGSALEHPELWESYVPKFAPVPGPAPVLGSTPVPYNPSAPTYAGAGQTYPGNTTLLPTAPLADTTVPQPPTISGVPLAQPPQQAPLGPAQTIPKKLIAAGGVLLLAIAALGFFLMRSKPGAPLSTPAAAEKTVATSTAPASAAQSSATAHPEPVKSATTLAAPSSPASSTPSSPAVAPQPEPIAIPITIPAGISIVVRTIGPIDASEAKKGDTFQASIDDPVYVDGKLAIPKESSASIKLVSETKGGRFRGSSKVEFELASFTLHGHPYSASSSKEEVTKEGGGNILERLALSPESSAERSNVSLVALRRLQRVAQLEQARGPLDSRVKMA